MHHLFSPSKEPALTCFRDCANELDDLASVQGAGNCALEEEVMCWKGREAQSELLRGCFLTSYFPCCLAQQGVKARQVKKRVCHGSDEQEI